LNKREEKMDRWEHAAVTWEKVAGKEGINPNCILWFMRVLKIGLGPLKFCLI